MGLVNISYCRYRTDFDTTWLPEHWRARNIIRAIKDDSFEGYSFLKIGGVTRRLDSSNPKLAVEWFVEAVREQTKFDGGTYYLCPIPDSQSTPTSTHGSRTLKLAQALSARIPQLKIRDVLRFKQPMQRKIRNEESLYNNMVCTSSVPTGYIILLDDVCTTGAHARAAQRLLVENGAKDMCAMSVARTMLNQTEETFGYRSDQL